MKRSPKYILSRILLHSGLCRLLTFESHGHRIRFFPTDLSAELWYNPKGRFTDNNFIKSYLKAGDSYVDVGANIGTTVIAGAFAVGSSGRVIAVEPHPRIYGYMLGNVALNDLKNVTGVNCGLSNEPGVVSFSDSSSDDQNHVEIDGQGKLQVTVSTLDEVTNSMETISLLKIDVEGFESRVLSGGAASLAKTDAIYIEVSDKLLKRFGSSASELLGCIHKAGFIILRWVDHSYLQEIRGVPIEFPHIENIVAVRNVADLKRRLGSGIPVNVAKEV